MGFRVEGLGCLWRAHSFLACQGSAPSHCTMGVPATRIWKGCTSQVPESPFRPVCDVPFRIRYSFSCLSPSFLAAVGRKATALRMVLLHGGLSFGERADGQSDICDGWIPVLSLCPGYLSSCEGATRIRINSHIQPMGSDSSGGDG